MIEYTRNAQAGRAFFRDVLEFPHVDVGGGRLIFALPSSEIALHPGEDNRHEVYLMCDEVNAAIVKLRAKGISCSDVMD